MTIDHVTCIADDMPPPVVEALKAYARHHSAQETGRGETAACQQWLRRQRELISYLGGMCPQMFHDRVGFNDE